MACIRAIERDYVNIAPGLRAVLPFQGPRSPSKERKYRILYGRRLLMSDTVTSTEEGFYPAEHTALNIFLALGD